MTRPRLYHFWLFFVASLIAYEYELSMIYEGAAAVSSGPYDTPPAAVVVVTSTTTTTAADDVVIDVSSLKIVEDVTQSNASMVLTKDFDSRMMYLPPPDNHRGDSYMKTSQRFYVAHVGIAFMHSKGVVFNTSHVLKFAGLRGPGVPVRIGAIETRKAVHLRSPVLSMLEFGSELIQHFPMQGLPLVGCIVRDFLSQRHDVRVVMYDLPQLRVIAPPLLGVDPGRIVWARKDEVHVSKETYIAGAIRPHGGSDVHEVHRWYPGGPLGTCAEAVSVMNHAFKPGFLPVDSTERIQVIYLTRGQNQDKRSVVNEPELLDFLRAELNDDLELVVFHTTGSVRQDIEAFARARAIIGPHGGAFMNTMFLPRGLDVVEFNSYRTPSERPFFDAVARCLDLRYWVVEPVNQFSYSRGPAPECRWLEICVDDFREILNQVGILDQSKRSEVGYSVGGGGNSSSSPQFASTATQRGVKSVACTGAGERLYPSLCRRGGSYCAVPKRDLSNAELERVHWKNGKRGIIPPMFGIPEQRPRLPVCMDALEALDALGKSNLDEQDWYPENWNRPGQVATYIAKGTADY